MRHAFHYVGNTMFRYLRRWQGARERAAWRRLWTDAPRVIGPDAIVVTVTCYPQLIVRGPRRAPHPEPWPYGPPDKHEECCVLRSGSAYCDCKASDEGDTEWGESAWPSHARNRTEVL